ncbi:hypothetical protein [Caminibacter sp.]
MQETIIGQQFTPVYDPKEDRIRLIININYPTRHDIWITRRFLINLLDNVSHLITDNIKTQQTTSPQNQNTIPQKIYKFRKKPKLIEELNISYNKDTNTYNLLIKDAKTSIESALTPEDLNNLIKHLIKPVKYEWGLHI